MLGTCATFSATAPSKISTPRNAKRKIKKTRWQCREKNGSNSRHFRTIFCISHLLNPSFVPASHLSSIPHFPHPAPVLDPACLYRSFPESLYSVVLNTTPSPESPPVLIPLRPEHPPVLNQSYPLSLQVRTSPVIVRLTFFRHPVINL